MADTTDLLQIKIEKAKRELPLETVNAINAVDWKASILGLRAKKGYTFEQLGDLEIETELVLVGLTNPENYPKELEKRMGISKSATDELVNEMNNMVFKKIREELIKNTERKKVFEQKSTETSSPQPLSISLNGEGKARGEGNQTDTKILSSAGIEIVPEKLEITNGEKPVESREDMLKKIEKPEEIHPMLAQKLSGSFQTPVVNTEHTLNNLTPNSTLNTPPKIDPYREIPE